MSYFVTRHTRHYLPLDPGAVVARCGTLDAFEVEGPLHPHLVIRSAQSHHTRAARNLADELDEDMKGLSAIAVLVTGIGGDFGLYAGSWDGDGWDWPSLEEVKDARRRCLSLMFLDDVDLVKVAEVASTLAMLSPEEEANFSKASSSSPKAEASTLAASV